MIGFIDYLESRGPLVRRWIAAGIVIMAVHIGGGAMALMTWPDEEPDTEPQGAMMIELAPMAVAQSTRPPFVTTLAPSSAVPA